MKQSSSSKQMILINFTFIFNKKIMILKKFRAQFLNPYINKIYNFIHILNNRILYQSLLYRNNDRPHKLISFDQIYKYYTPTKNFSMYQISELITFLTQTLRIKNQTLFNQVKFTELIMLIQNKFQKFTIEQHIKLLIFVDQIQYQHYPYKSISKLVDDCVEKIDQNIKNKMQILSLSQLLYASYKLHVHNRKINQAIMAQILSKLRQERSKNGSKNITVTDILYFFNMLIGKDILSRDQLRVQAMFIELIENQQNFIQKISIAEKCDLFSVIALCKLDYHLNDLKIPDFMYEIKQELQNKREQLSYQAIINLLEGLKYLPGQFDTLIIKLKSMILSRIKAKNKQKNLPFSFMLEYLMKISEWRKIKLEYWEQQYIKKFILMKLQIQNNQEKSILQKVFHIINNKLFQDNINTNLLQSLNKLIFINKITLYQMEVFLNFNYPIDELVQSFYKFRRIILQQHEIISLYHIIASIHQPTPYIESIRNELSSFYNKYIQTNTFQLADKLQNSILDDKYRTKLWKPIINQLIQKQFNNLERRQRINLIVSIINSCTDKQSEVIWNIKFTKYLKSYSKQIYPAILSNLNNLNNYYQLKIMYKLLDYVLSQQSLHEIDPIIRNKNIVYHSLQSDNNSKQLFKLINQYFDNQKFLSVDSYQIIKILQQLNCDSIDYHALLMKISLYKLDLKWMKLNGSFINLLLHKDLINKQNYQSLIQIMNSKMHYYTLLIRSVFQKDQLPISFSQLNIINIRILLNYNPILYEHKFVQIQEFIKSQLTNKCKWQELLFSLRRQFQHAKYRSIIMLVLNKFNRYVKELTITQILKIANKASQLNIKEYSFWKRFTQSIDFNQLNNRQLIRILEIFSQAHFYNPYSISIVELYHKILSNIDPYDKFQSKMVINFLFNINYKLLPEEFIRIIKLSEQLTQTNDINNLLKLLILNDNLEQIQQYIGKIIERTDSSLFRKSQIHIQYLIKKYPSCKWNVEQAKQSDIINYQLINGSSHISQIKPHIQLIAKAITVVQLLQIIKFDQITFDFKLNDQYIKFIDNDEYFNSEGSYLMGKGELLRKTLQQKYQVKIIFVNSQRFLLSEKKIDVLQMSRILQISSISSTINKTHNKTILTKKSKRLFADNSKQYQL